MERPVSLPSVPPPEPHGAEQLRLMKRAIVAMMFFGTANVMLAALTIGPEHAATQHWQFVAGGLLFVLGIVCLVLPARRGLFEVTTIGGLIAIGILIATAPDNSPGTTPFFFLWPCLFAAYFSSTRFVGIAMGSMAVIAAGALALSPYQARKPIAVIGVVSSVGVATLLVAAMRRREQRLNARLEVAANTDPLTGLMNRRAFNPQLEEAVRAAARTGQPLSVVLFDLDHFKQYNDAHGHLGGDDALRRMAGVLASASRGSDLVARFGGEEFAVVLPGADVMMARGYGERVVRALRGELVDRELRLSSSVGIAMFEDDCSTVDALLTRADEALYAAKEGGRSRVAWWAGEMVIGEAITEPEPDPPTTRAPREAATRKDDFEVPRLLGDGEEPTRTGDGLRSAV